MKNCITTAETGFAALAISRAKAAMLHRCHCPSCSETLVEEEKDVDSGSDGDFKKCPNCGSYLNNEGHCPTCDW
jgi:DNA polymerase III alpha subunit (gram-positive type)